MDVRAADSRPYIAAASTIGIKKMTPTTKR